MSKPTIKSLTEQLHKAYLENHILKTANASLTKSNEKLSGSPKVQEQLNMADAKVAELMKEVETLKSEKQRVVDEYHLLVKQSKELPLKLQSEINRLTGETYYNKGDKEIIIRDLITENEKLKSDYALLEDNYNNVDNLYNKLLDEFNKNLDQHRAIQAENHALKQEIERTNRHINLAENQLHREQSAERTPTIINHYHNCTINK